MSTYDIIHLAENEWSNIIMREVAAEWFKDHPDCEFVQVWEHGGWWLAFHRSMETVGTANGSAVMRADRPRPTDYSGVEQRRQVRPGFEGRRNIESLTEYAAIYDPLSHPYDPTAGDDMGQDFSTSDSEYERQSREELEEVAVAV